MPFQKKNNIKNKNILFKIILFAYAVFFSAFMVETMFVYYMPNYHVSGILSIIRIIIFSCSFILVLITFTTEGYKLSRNIIFAIASFLTLCIFSTLLALLHDIPYTEIIPWIISYLSFVCLFLVSSSINKFNDDDINSFLNTFSYLSTITVGILIISMLYLQLTTGALHFSVSAYILGIPVAYYLSQNNSRPFMLAITCFVCFLSFKRGLWIALLASFLLSHYFSPLKRVKFGTIFISFITIALVLSGTAFFFDKIFTDIYSIKMNFESSGGVDEISSGRFSVLEALINYLSYDFRWLFGSGFGATFNAFEFFSSSLEDWETSGVDIIFGQFWLTHGYILGTALFLSLASFIAHSFKSWCYQYDSLYRFLTLLLFFNFINSLFSFVYFDPIWPIAIGFLISRKNFTKLNIQRQSNRRIQN